MSSGKVLGFDFGSKRIGVSSGTLADRIAFPLTVIEYKGGDLNSALDKVMSLILENDPQLLIFGLPLQMGGSKKENPIMFILNSFLTILKEKITKDNLDVEIKLVDERLSSFEAQDSFNNTANATFSLSNKDAFAAQIILQRFFDNNLK